MPRISIAPAEHEGPNAVLTKALLNAAKRLRVPQKDLAPSVGLSPATLSRLSRGKSIDAESKNGELAILFVRMFRSLDALMGGDEFASRRWYHASNFHLNGVPSELVRTVQGLVHVVEYLDAMRGKL